MALIDCPECSAQVSEVAPACPKCGFPVATAVAAGAGNAAPAATLDSAPTAPTPEPEPLPTERSAEPVTVRGRRIPIAALLFWGGLTVGTILAAFKGEDGATPFRYVPYIMVFAGMLWFSVTELALLLRHRKRRH